MQRISRSETAKPRLIGVNHVALEVGDVDAALAFYGRIFSFTLRGKTEEQAFIDMGDQFLALMQTATPHADGQRHFGLVVDDRTAVRARAEAAGARMIEGRFLDFLDPWGNRIEVVEYADIQFTKAPEILRGMGLALEKAAAPRRERAAKGMAPAQAASAERRSRAEAGVPSESERRFLDAYRVGHLATADHRGAPHVVPVCYAVTGDMLYITVDEKPKRHVLLKRLRNIAENPAVAFVADRYDEDWSRLGWVMLRGRATVLQGGEEHDRAQALLRARYPQLLMMRIDAHPVIAMRIERATSWGMLDAAAGFPP